MKRKMNKYHAQSTKMVLLFVEIKAYNQNMTEMKSTVRSPNGKMRAKKLKANETLENKLDDQKEFLKDAKLKHDAALNVLQTRLPDQKQLVKDVKEDKKKLFEIFKHKRQQAGAGE